MNKPHLLFGALLSAAIFGSACSSDEAQPNPHFATAGKSSSAAGSDDGSHGLGGANDDPLSLGGSDATAGEPGSSGGMSTGQAGAPNLGGGGGGSDEPTYDCVLEPHTHLEIINACTDAVHIEKHPDLPAIP